MTTTADFELQKIAPHKYAVIVDGEKVGHIARGGWDWAGFINNSQVTSKHERRDWAAAAVAAKANAIVHRFRGESWDAICRVCDHSLDEGKHLRWDKQRRGEPLR